MAEVIRDRDETVDGQHINEDGKTDAQVGGEIGGVGGAVVGAVAGAAAGPLGALAGAAIGGIAGAMASHAAVGAVDKTDHDDAVVVDDRDRTWTPAAPMSANTPVYPATTPVYPATGAPVGTMAPINTTTVSPQTGEMDTRGPIERTVDAVTGDPIDDKTGDIIKTDTRGVGEKVADAVTGDRMDDKTGRIVR